MPTDGASASPTHSAESSGVTTATDNGADELAPARPRRNPLSVTFRSLKHRNYRLYFSGQLISLTGSWMQTTALTWLAYEITGQSKWPAIILASEQLPTVLLGAWGGSLADRWSRRSLLLVTQALLLLLALVLAGLVYGHAATPWSLLVVTALSGLVQAVDLPVRLAFVTDMVERDDVMNAVALNSLLFNVARGIGPGLAGWLLVTAGPGPCFIANGLSFLALVVGLLFMRTPDRLTSAVADPVSDDGGNGFDYLLARPALALLVLLSGLLCLCAWPFLSLLPGLAQRILAEDADGYSHMLSATGFGALAAALTVATFGTFARRRAFIETGVWVIGASLVGLSWVASLPLAVGCCAALGFGLILFFPTSQAVVQLCAADHNRGRIMAIWAMVQRGALPLGYLVAGPAADQLGEQLVLRVQGLICVVAAIGLWLALRRPGGASPTSAIPSVRSN
jgi:MFS family permease